MKNLSLVLVALLIIVGASLFFINRNTTIVIDDSEVATPTVVTEEVAVTPPVVEKTVVPETPVNEKETLLGSSLGDLDIKAYHYGTGEKELLFVGGIHGGYSWNTALVAYELMDYLEANPEAIPENVKVTVIPVLNPDGLAKVVDGEGKFAASAISTVESELVAARFNENKVDLNRNFDCDWQATGTWQSRAVSGGTAAFSEPESQAIRDYVESHDIAAAVVWYSAAGGVFASNCHDDIIPETLTMTNLYAKAAGYKAYESFDFYETTGDMVNWLAKNDIPAISVLLSTHRDVEWDKNRLGVEAMLKHFAE